MKRKLKQFLHGETAGGIVLIVAATLSMIMANIGVTATSAMRHGAEGLMAVFFFQVGLEIRREMRNGTLFILPIVAAIGGMVVPALIYVLFNHSSPESLRGWAVPSATDIAFALGVLSLVPGVPATLRILLLAIAVLDDIGAVIIIGLFYTAGKAIGGMIALGGVAAAMLVPRVYVEPLMHRLHGWVTFGVMPIFALINAGVSLKGLSLASLLQPVPLGIAAGLFIGKQLGIFSAIWITVKAGFAPKPKASWTALYGMSVLCGIGFTMSLFIGSLAFTEMEEARLGVLVGSLLSALVGYAILRKR